MDWHKLAEEKLVRLLTDTSYSWEKLYYDIQEYFPYVKKETIRSYLRNTDKYKEHHEPENKPVLVIGDLHIPFVHPNYLQFCKDTAKKYGVGRVVQIGDLFDQYAFSRWLKSPSAYGAEQELDMAAKEIQPWCSAFPELDFTESNHDKRYLLRAEEAGLPAKMFLPFNKIYKIPDTWVAHEELIIDNVLYEHGEGCTGKTGALDAAIREQISKVIGHFHTKGNCMYSASKRNLVFGLYTGCGIDEKRIAFAYGKKNKEKPILGCAIVHNSNHGEFVPMGVEYFRN